MPSHAVFQLRNNRRGNPTCEFFKGSVHVLQALMMTVCVFLYKLHKQLSAASKMRKAKKTTGLEKAAAVMCIVVVPLVGFIATYVLEEDQLHVRAGLCLNTPASPAANNVVLPPFITHPLL